MERSHDQLTESMLLPTPIISDVMETFQAFFGRSHGFVGSPQFSTKAELFAAAKNHFVHEGS